MEVEKVTNQAGETEYLFTAGGKEYRETKWSEVLRILQEEDNKPAQAGYREGRYMGD